MTEHTPCRDIDRYAQAQTLHPMLEMCVFVGYERVGTAPRFPLPDRFASFKRRLGKALSNCGGLEPA